MTENELVDIQDSCAACLLNQRAARLERENAELRRRLEAADVVIVAAAKQLAAEEKRFKRLSLRQIFERRK